MMIQGKTIKPDALSASASSLSQQPIIRCSLLPSSAMTPASVNTWGRGHISGGEMSPVLLSAQKYPVRQSGEGYGGGN